MTRKQSFAVYCKCGVDVRACDITQEQISMILVTYWKLGREILSKLPGAKVKGVPKHINGYLTADHEQLHALALERAGKAYKEAGECKGAAIVTMSAVSSYGKYLKNIGEKSKQGAVYVIRFGTSLYCDRLFLSI